MCFRSRTKPISWESTILEFCPYGLFYLLIYIWNLMIFFVVFIKEWEQPGGDSWRWPSLWITKIPVMATEKDTWLQELLNLLALKVSWLEKKRKAEGNWHFNSMWLSFLVTFRHFYFYFLKLGLCPSRKLQNYCSRPHI